MLDAEKVRYVAKLARVDLTDEELTKFAGQLSDILKYMEILNEVDTDNVEETNHVTGLDNVEEKDEILPSQSSREELLDCSELPVDSSQVRVMHAIK